MDGLVQTIDLSRWFTGDAEARLAVVEEIDQECRRVGFLRVSGHGVAAELIEQMLDVTTARATIRHAVGLGAYFAACQALAGELNRMFAVALGMPEDFIFDKINRAACVMRANNYERRSHHADPEPGQVRMGAHTDYGVCTILLADPVPGLQIVGPDGAWHDVLPDPGTFLVNLGDLLAEWTNDRWRSTLHRVVPPTVVGPARRRSVAFFQEANCDALVEVCPHASAPTTPLAIRR